MHRKLLLAALGAIFLLLAGPAQALQCVPFARIESGIGIRGDAWMWWNEAAGVYERGQAPRVGSVLVFKRHGSMRLGHVSVVTRVVSSREILVDHANWGSGRGSRGRISTHVGVLDVSPANDWTEVRVWNDGIRDFGTGNYPTYGFIYANRPNRRLEVEDTAYRVAGQAAAHGRRHVAHAVAAAASRHHGPTPARARGDHEVQRPAPIREAHAATGQQPAGHLVVKVADAPAHHAVVANAAHRAQPAIARASTHHHPMTARLAATRHGNGRPAPAIRRVQPQIQTASIASDTRAMEAALASEPPARTQMVRLDLPPPAPSARDLSQFDLSSARSANSGRY